MERTSFTRAMAVAAIVMTAIPLLHCGGSSIAVDQDSCGAITPGEIRTAVNAALGHAGGGGGGDDWCDIWYGDFNNGPCCAVALTSCDADGTVTGVAFEPNGCANKPAP